MPLVFAKVMGAYGVIAISMCSVISVHFTKLQILKRLARRFRKPTATPIETRSFCLNWPTKGSRLRLDLAMTGMTSVDVVAKPVETASADFLTESEFKQKEKENLIAVLRCANWRVWGPDGAAAMLGVKALTLTYRTSSFGISKDQA